MRAIYAGETPVGFLMTSEIPENGMYFLWRIMVDAKHQGKGYGRRAGELLIERIRNSGNSKELLTSHLKGDQDAGGSYEKLGFEYAGEIHGKNEQVMRLGF